MLSMARRTQGPRFVPAAAVVVLLLAACAPAGTHASFGAALVEPASNQLPVRLKSRPEDRFFDVLTFNAALLPEVVSYTQPAARVPLIAQHLVGYDAVVLQEVFVNSWREKLLAELIDHYPHQGDLVGADGAGGNPFRQDGGVIILSRWPIVKQATLLFGSACSGTDCLADKGVAYVAVRKGDRTYHLFSTHLQSSFGFRVPAVQAEQFALLSAFVAAQRSPPDETVLITGDLNVDAFTPALGDMLASLQASWPPVIGPLTATWDPPRNAWAYGRTHWLDYVLVADGYGAPAAAWNRVVALRAEEMDLSDHFAVWGRVRMPLADRPSTAPPVHGP